MPVDGQWIGGIIVQQKRLSRKWSWTEHRTSEPSFRKAITAAAGSRDGGRPYRFIYAINVYAKESQ